MPTPSTTQHDVDRDNQATSDTGTSLPSNTEAPDEAMQAKNYDTASVLEGAAGLEVAQEDETYVDRATSRKAMETAATKGAQEGMKAEMYYILNNHAFNVLVSMSIGLTDSDGSPIFDNEVPPWNNSMKCKEWKPKMTHLADEIIRRWTAYSWALHGIANCPRPKGWKAEKAISWLMDHPINWALGSDSNLEIKNDVRFAMQEMEKKKVLLQDYATNKAEQDAELEGR